jgi:hypothetical protein
MSVPRSGAEVLADHVTLEVEGIDRMYLNVYVPGLQTQPTRCSRPTGQDRMPGSTRRRIGQSVIFRFAHTRIEPYPSVSKC